MPEKMSEQQADMPNSLGRSFNAPKVLWAMAFISMVATLLVNGMPVVIGTLGDAYGIPNDQLGILASAFLAGKFLVVVSSIFWVRRVDWRRISLVGMICGFILLTVLLFNPSHLAFLVSFVLLGAAMSCFYVPVLAYWSDVDDPARAVSIGILLQVVGAALFMFATPAWFVPKWGVQGLVGFLMVMLALNFFLVPLIPTVGREQAAQRVIASESKVLVKSAALLPLIGLVVMSLYYIGLFGLWAFLERIGTAGGLSSEAAASALSISLLAGASAVVVTSIVGGRFGYVRPLIVSVLMYGLFLLSMSWTQTTILFVSALIIFNLAWNGALPYQIGIIAKADTEGRYLVLLPAFQAAGAAAGPYVAGLLSADGNYSGLYIVFVASVAVSFFGYTLIATRLRLIPSESQVNIEA